MRYPFENCFEFQRNVHRYPLFTVLNIFSYTPLSCVDRNVRVCHWCTRCESGGYGGGLGLPRTGRTGLLRARPHSLSSQHRNYRNQSSVRRTFLPSGRLFDPAPTYTRFSRSFSSKFKPKTSNFESAKVGYSYCFDFWIYHSVCGYNSTIKSFCTA